MKEMNFFYNGKGFETETEVYDYIYDEYAPELYDDYLDEQGDVEVFGLKYKASKVLKSVNEIAYRRGYSDFCDMLFSDIEVITL